MSPSRIGHVPPGVSPLNKRLGMMGDTIPFQEKWVMSPSCIMSPSRIDRKLKIFRFDRFFPQARPCDLPHSSKIEEI